MKYHIQLLLFFSIFCFALSVAMDEGLTTIFIPEGGKLYEIKINKAAAKVKDLKEIIINNENETEDYEQLKKIAVGSLMKKDADNLSKKQLLAIKNAPIKLIKFEDIDKKIVVSDSSKLENEGKYIFKDNPTGLSEDGGVPAIKTIANLFEQSGTEEEKNKSLKEEAVEEQQKSKQSELIIEALANKKNTSYVKDIFNIALYLELPIIKKLPDLIVQNSELFTSKEFFITDDNIKKTMKDLFVQEFKDELLQDSAYYEGITKLKVSKIANTLAWHKNIFAIGLEKGIIQIVDASDPKNPTLQSTIKSSDSDTTWLIWHPTHDVLTSLHADGMIRIWDVSDETNPNLLTTLKSDAGKKILSMALKPGGKFLACGFGDGIIEIWNIDEINNPRVEVVLKDNHFAVNCLKWNPTQELLIAGCKNGMAYIWDLSNLYEPTHKSVWAHKSGPIDSVDWSEQKQRYFATGFTRSASIEIWNAPPQPKNFVATINNNQSANSGVATYIMWDSKSRFLAANSASGYIRIWNTENVTAPFLQTILAGHDDDVINCLAWNSTGEILASGAGDDIINLWQRIVDPALTFEQLLTLIILKKYPKIMMNGLSWIYKEHDQNLLHQKEEKNIDFNKDVKELLLDNDQEKIFTENIVVVKNTFKEQEDDAWRKKKEAEEQQIKENLLEEKEEEKHIDIEKKNLEDQKLKEHSKQEKKQEENNNLLKKTDENKQKATQSYFKALIQWWKILKGTLWQLSG